MGIFDVHLMAQTLLYFGTFIAGFAICIPVGVTNIYFGGKCILYADFDWKNNTYFVMNSSNHTNCNFPIYLGVFACIFYSLGMGVYNAYAVYKSRIETHIASQMWVMPFMLLNSLVCFSTLIAACIISIGFADFCSGYKKNINKDRSCSSAQNREWRDLNSGDKFNTKNFYSLLTVAELAAWITVAIWLCQVALGILRFVRNRKLRSQGSDDKDKITSLEPTA